MCVYNVSCTTQRHVLFVCSDLDEVVGSILEQCATPQELVKGFKPKVPQ